MNIQIIGGVFNDAGGRPSGYINKLADALSKELGNVATINGGTWAQLEQLVNDDKPVDALCWLADIPNDKPKLLKSLRKNPATTFVISKNNRDGQYTYPALVARILTAKAHLSIVFTQKGEAIEAELIDPLGNSHGGKTTDIAALAAHLAKRLTQLRSFTRMRSTSLGPIAIPAPQNIEFFNAIRSYADTLHRFIHTENQDRFLGNASFRCTRGGFPAIRDTAKSIAWISKRNMDKREIACDSFVPVSLEPSENIRYWGDHPPSVDAPIQAELFRRLPWVNYMLHTHAYIIGAPFTRHLIPCGALEEVDDVIEALNGNCGPFAFINLMGHGSLAIADTPEPLTNILFEARPIPEVQHA